MIRSNERSAQEPGAETHTPHWDQGDQGRHPEADGHHQIHSVKPQEDRDLLPGHLPDIIGVSSPPSEDADTLGAAHQETEEGGCNPGADQPFWQTMYFALSFPLLTCWLRLFSVQLCNYAVKSGYQGFISGGALISPPIPNSLKIHILQSTILTTALLCLPLPLPPPTHVSLTSPNTKSCMNPCIALAQLIFVSSELY